MNPTGQIKVLVVDDHPVVRDGLQNMLLAFDDLEMVAEAENGLQAVALCQQSPRMWS
jgi:DNA-binding NarL/FixJ family response regulator